MHPADMPDCLRSNPYLWPNFCHVSCHLSSPYRTSPPKSGHIVIIFRFPLLFLLLLPLDLILPSCPLASLSSTTFQFPFADSSPIFCPFFLSLFPSFVICIFIRISLSAYSLSFALLIFFLFCDIDRPSSLSSSASRRFIYLSVYCWFL